MKCPYRSDKECQYDDPNEDVIDCNMCLFGQQIDELSLMNSAIANMTASIEEHKAEKIMEAVHKEEYE